jgi:tricorn protease
VTIAPHDWAAGRDPQLDTAVRLALQTLEQRTPAAPPTIGHQNGLNFLKTDTG